MKNLALAGFGVLLSLPSLAQTDSCENGRYIDDIFTSTTSTLDIKYGENTSISGNTIELFADVFEPANDSETKRPLMILMHGGSFTSGERTDIHDLCEGYALKGYVVASINYRLYDGPLIPFPDSLDMGEVLIQSVGDAKAAVRYFKNDAATTDLFKIDTNTIIVGGVSAGAMTALHVAYLDENDDTPQFIDDILANNGGLEGNSNNLFQHSSEVHGVISFSGALYRDHFLDGNEAPVFSVHDELDGIVPYGDDFAVVLVVPIVRVNGSELVHARAVDQGVASHLITYPGSGGHVAYFPEDAEELIDSSALFMAGELLCDLASSTEELTSQTTYKVYPNPVKNKLFIDANTIVSQVEVKSLLGNSIPVTFDGQSIDLTHVNTGIYLLELYGQDGQRIHTQKLIKQ